MYYRRKILIFTVPTDNPHQRWLHWCPDFPARQMAGSQNGQRSYPCAMAGNFGFVK
jgi:hypothetical protein